jgi:ribonuclease D
LTSINSLGDLLSHSSIVKILHAGDYDIRSLNRDYGFKFTNVFDTSIAAAFLGSERLGLDAILKEYINVIVSKDKKLQRSDWTIRPLSDEAIEYAANDVLHLKRAKESITAKLKDLGRYYWVEEEFVRLSDIRFNPKNEQTAFLNVKGNSDLNGKELAILKHLYDFREDIAIGRDRPPFKIISDSILVELAKDPYKDITKIFGIGSWSRTDKASQLKSVIDQGINAPAIERPSQKKDKPKSLSNKEREVANLRLRSLKEWRKKIGNSLKLDPSLLWPTVSLNRLSRFPDLLEQELDQPEVRKWQINEFYDPINIHLKQLD